MSPRFIFKHASHMFLRSRREKMMVGLEEMALGTRTGFECHKDLRSTVLF